jgi:hypothetical protein
MNMASGVFTPLLISIWHLGNLDQQGINPIQNLHFFLTTILQVPVGKTNFYFH